MRKQHGFTIVELLIVIVVIALLAAIVIVSFAGMRQRADTTSIQADLTNNSRKLKAYQAIYSSYPTALNGSNCPTTPTVDPNYCLKFSNGTSLISYTGTTTTFVLRASRSGVTDPYQATESTNPVAYSAPTGPPSAAPSGIVVNLDGSWQMTVIDTGAPVTQVRWTENVGSGLCINNLSATVSPVSSGTITVTPTGTRNPACSGWLGDVPNTVWFTNSYGSGPTTIYNDYWS